MNFSLIILHFLSHDKAATQHPQCHKYDVKFSQHALIEYWKYNNFISFFFLSERWTRPQLPVPPGHHGQHPAALPASHPPGADERSAG